MRTILFVALIILSIPPVFSASLEEHSPLEQLVGSEQAAVLRIAPGPIIGLPQKTLTPRLLPRHEELERYIARMKSSLESNMLVEALSLYRKPSPAEWTEAEQTGLLNQLTALSTLAGIEYYSESRKAMRIFYESSQVIDDPAAKNPLPDPVYTTLPASLVLYARQKDLTFGDNIYRYHYQTGADAIFFVQENVTSMNVGIIPAVGKNNFHVLVAVIDAGDSLLVYAAIMAKALSVPGMGNRVGASFTNRMNAIFHWFTGRADQVYNVARTSAGGR